MNFENKGFETEPDAQKVEFKIGNAVLGMSVKPEVANPQRLVIEDIHLSQSEVASVSISQHIPRNWRVIATSETMISESADFLDREIIIRKQVYKKTEEVIPAGEEMPPEEQTTTATPFGDSEHQVITNTRSRKVYTLDSRPYFERAGSLLILLHELSHAIRSEGEGCSEDDKERERQLLLQRISPEEKLRIEISCWAYAIETIHKLQNLGFDFEGEFSDEKIKKQLDAPLWSYGYKGDIKTLINYIFAVVELEESGIDRE